MPVTEIVYMYSMKNKYLLVNKHSESPIWSGLFWPVKLQKYRHWTLILWKNTVN